MRLNAYFVSAAFLAAQRFLSAATMLALPSALNFRFFVAAVAFAALVPASTLDAAHLFRCPAAMAFLPAALILRRGCFSESAGG